MEAVRAATTYDEEALAALTAAWRAERRGRRGGSLLEEPPWVGRGGPLPGEDAGEQVLLVATLDEVVVGFATGRFEDGGAGERRGVLEVCFVEPQARGVGLGRLLLDAVVTWCTAAGCSGVDGDALPGDREAKSFFEAAGFKARRLTMYRELG